MKLTIHTIVGTFDKTKDGKPFITKQGKPYKKTTVKFTEAGDKMVTMPVWSGQADPKVGDVVEGEITEREWQGKKYYDFKADKKDDKVLIELAQIKFSQIKHDQQIKEIQEFLRSQYPQFNKTVNNEPNTTSNGDPMPNFDVNQELDAIANDEQEIDY